MKSNNLRQEHQNVLEQPVLLVFALGFGAAIEEKLKQLFQLERHGRQAYKLVSLTETNINILLVNYDNPLALRKKGILLSSICSGAEVVAVSQGPLNDAPPYHIRGMLTASRLLGVLDKISVSSPVTQETALARPNITEPVQLELVQSPSKTIENVVPVVLDVPETASKSASQYRALVVDDSAAIQKSLELKLATLEQIAGIDFADSGEMALAMADANEYHLIFLDVMMPGMDGYETCTQLRKKPEYKKTPIIMVSGKTSPLDEVKGIMAGCTTYLTKPVQDQAFQKLSIRILAWLTDRKASAKSTS